MLEYLLAQAGSEQDGLPTIKLIKIGAIVVTAVVGLSMGAVKYCKDEKAKKEAEENHPPEE